METGRLFLYSITVEWRLLPRRKQTFDTAKHPLFKVPKEPELPEQKAVGQQQYLIGR